MSEVKELKRKKVKVLFFSFEYVKGITDEFDIIQGLNISLFGKRPLTIAVANNDWVDEDGVSYKLKWDRDVLFIKQIAIGLL